MSPKTNNFFQNVYEVCKLIPYGRVTSYGAIASYLGAARSARMVGWAMNNAHTMPEIPAHRVLNREGVLTGKFHFATLTDMQETLESEGIIIVNDKVEDFKRVFWDPTLALL
ncbi:MAG: hypothetical protein RL711_521 [Bacteroidota bacterium]|jgi:methylated-DNA-protein-cysteine methyltransferase-like protein